MTHLQMLKNSIPKLTIEQLQAIIDDAKSRIASHSLGDVLPEYILRQQEIIELAEKQMLTKRFSEIANSQRKEAVIRAFEREVELPQESKEAFRNEPDDNLFLFLKELPGAKKIDWDRIDPSSLQVVSMEESFKELSPSVAILEQQQFIKASFDQFISQCGIPKRFLGMGENE